MIKFKTENIIPLATGLVFVSEGVQKFLFASEVGAGRFAKIGVPYPDATSYVVAIVEIIAGSLLLLQIQKKVVVIPLLVVMAGAIWFTKIPAFINKGFWVTAHEGRTDFMVTSALIYILLSTAKKD